MQIYYRSSNYKVDKMLCVGGETGIIQDMGPAIVAQRLVVETKHNQ